MEVSSPLSVYGLEKSTRNSNYPKPDSNLETCFLEAASLLFPIRGSKLGYDARKRFRTVFKARNQESINSSESPKDFATV